MNRISKAPKRVPPLQPLPQNKTFLAALARLPMLQGDPIELRFLPQLTASRGKLLSGAGLGKAVHAASYLRTRQMTLESDLLENETELTRILLHELFHFIWVRLGNEKRKSYQSLILAEWHRRSRGEAGWSAELVKARIKKPGRSRLWRLYVCESFCDSGAAYAARFIAHPEFTLAKSFWAKRSEWFGILFAADRIYI